MSDTKTVTGFWSDPIPWPVNRDPMAVPSMVRVGDRIKSDIMVRPEYLNDFPQAFYPGYEWTVIEGSAFMISQPGGGHVSKGVVMGSFQVWMEKDGTEVRTEEELLRELIREAGE